MGKSRWRLTPARRRMRRRSRSDVECGVWSVDLDDGNISPVSFQQLEATGFPHSTLYISTLYIILSDPPSPAGLSARFRGRARPGCPDGAALSPLWPGLRQIR